jgi:hypothetical protein
VRRTRWRAGPGPLSVVTPLGNRTLRVNQRLASRNAGQGQDNCSSEATHANIRPAGIVVVNCPASQAGPGYFFTTTAMQLISTSEFPGRAATATVVRAGPPFGK